MSRFPACRCALRTLAVAVVLVVLIIRPIPAATSNWNTDTGGDFSNPSNWDNGVPHGADTAVFRRRGLAYVVQLTGSTATSKLQVGTNTVTFQPLNSKATYSVNYSPLITRPDDVGVAIGESAGDTAVVNSSLPSFSFSAAELGAAAGSSGTLNVLTGTVSGKSFYIGVLGSGAVNVSNGATVTGQAGLGTEIGSLGAITIIGLGSTWNGPIGIQHGNLSISGGGKLNGPLLFGISQSGPSFVAIDGQNSTVITTNKVNVSGDLGSSEMTITNGGKAQTGSGGIADSSGSSTGEVTVDGIGSAWVNSGDLRIGGCGSGMLTVHNGGLVSNAIGYIGSANRGIGSVTVDGTGSSWASSGALYVGPNSGAPTDLSGRGELNVIHGGAVSTAADGVIDVTSSASIDGAGSRWSVGGNLTVNGALSITNGALVTSKNGTIDATLGPAQVTISGPGAKWAATGDVLINSGTLSLSEGGELAATGSITNYANIRGNAIITGNVTNYGVIMPNGSPGRLTIAGNFAQGLGSYGTVQIELGGTQAGVNYDQLVVTGTASLGGLLKVALSNFTPVLHDAFHIIEAGSFDSAFSNYQLPKLANGLRWNTSQLSSTGEISVFSGVAGDFNQDGHVNAGDISVMLAALVDLGGYEGSHNFGDAELNAIGDLDHSGAVTNADLQGLLDLLKSGGGSVNAVPEPAALELLACAFAILMIKLSFYGGKVTSRVMKSFCAIVVLAISFPRWSGGATTAIYSTDFLADKIERANIDGSGVRSVAICTARNGASGTTASFASTFTDATVFSLPDV